MEAKLSSSRIISAACLLTSDPAIPIATPTASASASSRPTTTTTTSSSTQFTQNKEKTPNTLVTHSDRPDERGEFSRALWRLGGPAPSLKNTKEGVLDGFFLTWNMHKIHFRPGRTPLGELTTLPQTPSLMVRGHPSPRFLPLDALDAEVSTPSASRSRRLLNEVVIGPQVCGVIRGRCWLLQDVLLGKLHLVCPSSSFGARDITFHDFSKMADSRHLGFRGLAGTKTLRYSSQLI